MKSFAGVLSVALAFTLNAFGQLVSVPVASPAPSPISALPSPLACFEKAKTVTLRGTLVGEAMAAKLCSGATSDAPIHCAEKAAGEVVEGAQMEILSVIQLCAGARDSLIPLRCFREARTLQIKGVGYLGPINAVNLCARAATSSASIDCLKAALQRNDFLSVPSSALLLCRP